MRALPILPRLGSATLTPLRPRPQPFVQTWNRRSFLRRALHVSLVPVRMGHYSFAPAAGLRAPVHRWEHPLHFEIMMNFARRDETPLHENFCACLARGALRGHSRSITSGAQHSSPLLLAPVAPTHPCARSWRPFISLRDVGGLPRRCTSVSQDSVCDQATFFPVRSSARRMLTDRGPTHEGVRC